MKNKRETSFFDIYADEYDILTNAKRREEFHRKEIAHIIKTFKPESVLDAGCATGLTTYLFADQGVTAKGIDCSRSMIAESKKKYPDQLNLSFQYGKFEKLPKALHHKYDLVVCLANSISGVGSLNNLNKAIGNFYSVLKPGGYLLLQMLNYYSINDGEFYPIKATRNGNIVYQRFSERRGKRLFVYVNRLDLSDEKLKYEMFRHEFENFDVKEMVSVLKRTGFKKVKKNSDLYLQKPFTKTCRDLVLTGQKSR